MKKQDSCVELLDADADPSRSTIHMVKNERQNARKNLLCAMFLFFVLLASLAVLYVISQGFMGKRFDEIWHGSPKIQGNGQIFIGDRPPYKEKAKMARYIVHNSQWGVLTTFSLHAKGYSWGEVVSVTDGLVNNSTGIPLIYISPFDVAAQDINVNPLVSFTFSEAEQTWCRNNKIDPEDPRCSRVHLFGKIVKLTADEIPAAKKAMFTKHPAMASWPKSHKFFFAKINLTRVEVLDYFGPLSYVSIQDYLKATP